MANKKSSKKDILRIKARNIRNRSNKSKLHTLEKSFLKNISLETFKEFEKNAQSIARKGIVSRQHACRKISKFHLLLKSKLNQGQDKKIEA